MKLFRIRIEIIGLILLFATAVAGYILSREVVCWQTTAMFAISILMLLVWCMSYTTIRDFRREVIKRW